MNYWKRQTSDAIRGLTQDRLTAQIESYNNGYLADFALTAEAMEQRDDVLKNVIAKRKKAVTRHGWEVGKYRVYEHQVSAKNVDLTVEHYSNTIATSTLGIRNITLSYPFVPASPWFALFTRHESPVALPKKHTTTRKRHTIPQKDTLFFIPPGGRGDRVCFPLTSNRKPIL